MRLATNIVPSPSVSPALYGGGGGAKHRGWGSSFWRPPNRSRLLAATCALALSPLLPPDMPRAAAATEFAVAGGAATAVAIHGSTAWVAVGAQVLTFDVSDPARPTDIGAPLPLPEVAADIATVDGVLYAVVPGSRGGAGARLLAWDVSRPAAARAMGGATTLPAREVGAIAVAFGLAGIVTDDGVLVVDVKDPARPIVVGRVRTGGDDLPRSAIGDIAMLGDHALVARPWGLYTFDLADPTPRSLRRLQERPARGVAAAVGGDRAFVVLEDGTIEVYMMRDGGDIAATASIAGAVDSPLAVAAGGARLYVVDAQGRRMKGFDTSGTDGIVLDATVPLAGYGSRSGAIAASGGRGLFALEPAGVGFFDAGAVDHIARPTSAIVPPIVHAATDGSRTYAAAGVAGLFVVDGDVGNGDSGSRGVTLVTDASGWRAEAVDRESNDPRIDVRAADVQAVAAAGGLVFACLGEDGIAAVDGGLPEEGTLLGRMADGPTCQSRADMVVARGRLYYVTTDHGLAAVDVSEPRAMRSVYASGDLGLMAIAAGRDGSLLATGFVGATTGILRAFDVGDPDQPQQIGHHVFDRPFGKLAVAGSLALLSGGFGHLAIVDVGDPTRPIQRAAVGGIAVGKVALKGDVLYAAQPGWIDTLLVGAGGGTLPLSRSALPWAGDDWIGASDVVGGGAGDERLVVLRGRAGLYFSGEADDPPKRSDADGDRRATRIAYLPMVRSDGGEGESDAAASVPARLPQPRPTLVDGPYVPLGPLPVDMARSTSRPPLAGDLPLEPQARPDAPADCRPAARLILAVDTSAASAPLWHPTAHGGHPGATRTALGAAVKRLAGSGTSVDLIRFDSQAELVAIRAGAGDAIDALPRDLATFEDPPPARLDLALVASREALVGPARDDVRGTTPASAVIVLVTASPVGPHVLALAERESQNLRAMGAVVYIVAVAPDADIAALAGVAGSVGRVAVARTIADFERAPLTVAEKVSCR